MFRPRVFAIAVAAVSALSLGSGCATVARGFSVPKVEVTSDPAGARVFMDDKEVGRTPVTLKRLAWGTHRLRMESPEGVPPETRSIRVTKEFNSPATWEAAFIGVWGIGLPGFLVDWCAGTAYEYTIEDWHVSFVKPKPVQMPGGGIAPPMASASSGPIATSAPSAGTSVTDAMPPGISLPSSEEGAFPPSDDAGTASIDALLEDIIHQDEK